MTMPSMWRLPFLLLFAGLVETAGASAQTGANVLLVVNESSPDSLRIAAHYARARAAPLASSWSTISRPTPAPRTRRILPGAAKTRKPDEKQPRPMVQDGSRRQRSECQLFSVPESALGT
jgi:hypothetical protein